MPTVCIDCRYIGARPSGIGELVRALVDHVPALAPDLRFLLLRDPAGPERLSPAANVVQRTVPHAANGPATMWWLPRVVDLSGVDLFHATFNTLPAGLAMPSLVTVHDVMWLTDPDLCRTGVRGAVERRFYGHGLRRALDRADAIAAVSHATADAIARHHPPAAARTHVTLSGVAPRFAPGAADPARLSALGLDPARRFVLVVGQDAPYKNHAGALAGFAAAFADDPAIDLVMVRRQGRGRDRARFAARVAALGLAGRVRMLPAIDGDALLTLYRAASALLHPSFQEGFGNPLAEAMACGCPVVTADRSAMPEVASGAALLVDPHDPAAIGAALRRVLSDRAGADRMRAAGIARARALDWSAFAAANVALYRRILANSGAGSS